MVVQHNMQAINANRMLNVTSGAQAKSTEKLSSGYRINRAADDAAGLSISEKMRKQIKGLSQASKNAQDGVSAVQTAEGALTEVHSMLQRMNELAVQSANGTNSETDRKAIQDEIDQLTTEIDRVSETTKFNETYLLQGDGRRTAKAADTSDAVKVKDTDGTDVDTKITATIAAGNEYVAGNVKLGSVTAKASDNGSLDMDKLSGALLTALNAAAADTDINVAHQTDGTYKIGSDATKYSVEALKKMGLNIDDTGADVKVQKNFTSTDAADLPTGMSISTTGLVLTKVAVGTDINVTLKTDDSASGNGMTVEAFDPTYTPDPLKFKLHVGADSEATNKIEVEIASMSSNGLGLLESDGHLHVDGSDGTNATKAIDTIAAALQKVSDQRSAIGAVQNRLEHTISNLDNVVENTTSAESRIRDTDMAEEMVNYSKNNILAQAGQSMLAQANQSTQGVLSLLG